MSAHYFQIAYQLHVMGQNVVDDVLTGETFLGAFRNAPCNNVVSFRPVLKIVELSFQTGQPSGVRFIAQCILYRLDFFICKFKFLLKVVNLTRLVSCFGLQLLKFYTQDIMAVLAVRIKLVYFHRQTFDRLG